MFRVTCGAFRLPLVRECAQDLHLKSQNSFRFLDFLRLLLLRTQLSFPSIRVGPSGVKHRLRFGVIKMHVTELKCIKTRCLERQARPGRGRGGRGGAGLAREHVQVLGRPVLPQRLPIWRCGLCAGSEELQTPSVYSHAGIEKLNYLPTAAGRREQQPGRPACRQHAARTSSLIRNYIPASDGERWSSLLRAGLISSQILRPGQTNKTA